MNEKMSKRVGMTNNLEAGKLMSRKEVAELLGYKSTVSVKRLEKSGRIRGVWINSRVVRYDSSQISNIINGTA
jgi:hypothetical protein